MRQKKILKLLQDIIIARKRKKKTTKNLKTWEIFNKKRKKKISPIGIISNKIEK